MCQRTLGLYALGEHVHGYPAVGFHAAPVGVQVAKHGHGQAFALLGSPLEFGYSVLIVLQKAICESHIQVEVFRVISYQFGISFRIDERHGEVLSFFLCHALSHEQHAHQKRQAQPCPYSQSFHGHFLIIM